MPMFQHRLSRTESSSTEKPGTEADKRENRPRTSHAEHTELINASVLNGLLAVNRFTGTERSISFLGDI